MAYESLALISTALHHLDCGQLGVCRLDFVCFVRYSMFLLSDMLCSWFVPGLVRAWRCCTHWTSPSHHPRGPLYCNTSASVRARPTLFMCVHTHTTHTHTHTHAHTHTHTPCMGLSTKFSALSTSNKLVDSPS